MMDNDDIMKMCRSLARKYNDPQEYDDLVSEGVVKVLEMVAEGKTEKNLLYSHAQSAMYEHYNLNRGPVKIPNSSQAYSTNIDDDVDGWTATALHQALYGDAVEYEDYMSQVPSTEELYEQKEWYAKVQTVAITCLTQEEWAIIRMRYWDDMTQDAVGKEMCRNKMWVSRHEKAALEKIRNNL
jgi:RNA polymerase sigma factor (sigma-70 family)